MARRTCKLRAHVFMAGMPRDLPSFGALGDKLTPGSCKCLPFWQAAQRVAGFALAVAGRALAGYGGPARGKSHVEDVTRCLVSSRSRSGRRRGLVSDGGDRYG